mgnify:CR=1 FL=1
MKRQLLLIDCDFDFYLIGINCVLKDYRLCFEINRKLNLRLKRVDEIVIIKENSEWEHSAPSFSNFAYLDEKTELLYKVVSNKCQSTLLIPEQKAADYFLKISGEGPIREKKAILSKIREIPIVLTAFEINPNKLKSKNNMLFND